MPKRVYICILLNGTVRVVVEAGRKKYWYRVRRALADCRASLVKCYRSDGV